MEKEKEGMVLLQWKFLQISIEDAHVTNFYSILMYIKKQSNADEHTNPNPIARSTLHHPSRTFSCPMMCSFRTKFEKNISWLGSCAH